MNIVYTTNETFVPQTAAGIASVCENNREEEEILFYVFSLGIRQETEDRLAEMVQSYDSVTARRSVQYIELEDMQKHFDFSFDTSGWNPIVLARLLVGDLLPDDVQRVLYLDGDTIVRGSLRELWQTDMGDSSVAAAPEPTCDRKRKESLGLKNLPYCNAGVLLIDLGNWRKYDTGKKIIGFYREHDGKLLANDQDAINGCEKERIRILSMTYNYHNTYDIYRYRLLQEVCDYPIPTREEFERVRKDPCIVHFLGEERPWRKGCPNRFRDEYMKYLRLTPWKDQPLESGWESYFLRWRAFNTVMRPFPVLRLRIINALIPKRLEKRREQS